MTKLLQALRLEAESIAQREIDQITNEMDGIWEQKRAAAMVQAQREIDQEKVTSDVE